MPQINLLPKNIAELIAAGEVVERPASVIKELMENSVDAGATKITVEIKNGGISLMRITDNGCGIEKGDIKTAFLRHATSKVKTANDLDSIATLGFRGEALASVGAVARVEMITRTQNENEGTRYVIEGGEEKVFEEAGCEKGTTVIVRDLFFNTPARMKFLRKDVSEGNTAAAVAERMALSHPEVAIRFIRDNKVVLNTTGDGNLRNTVYSVLGREYSASLIPVNYEMEHITVTGYVCKPVYCRNSRSGQYFFLNGRTVRSGTAVSALERAYKNSAMVGKFPSCVLNLGVPYNTVDVNVHPAKTEVRFSNEQLISNAVYFAVKNALEKGDTRPTVNIKTPKFSSFEHITAEQYKQSVIKTETEKTPAEEIYFNKTPKSTVVHFSDSKPTVNYPYRDKTVVKTDENNEYKIDKSTGEVISATPVVTEEKQTENKAEVITETPVKKDETVTFEEIQTDIKYIGEAFATYIIVQKGESVFFIDKHAAHERILFEKLKSTEEINSQSLLIPVNIKLDVKEYNAVLSNSELLSKSGFEIEDFGNGTIIVRAVPSPLIKEDVTAIMYEVASSLANTGNADIPTLDGIYHTVACKAAIKAGYITSEDEQLKLAIKVLKDNKIMYCPHGRPVAFELKKRDLEKQFGRIQ